jgi:hypothetical protein
MRPIADLPFLSASEVRDQNQTKHYRADNACDALGTDAGAEESYFESLRLCHEQAPSNERQGRVAVAISTLSGNWSGRDNRIPDENKLLCIFI